MNRLEGIILKGIGGFYYVEAADAVYECKARGIFRKEGKKPLAGDRVVISINENAENTIDEIMPRKSELTRPPVANIDRLFIMAAVREPNPSLYIIDKMTALAHINGIEPVVVFTKCDLGDPTEYLEIYKKAGIEAFAVSCVTGEGVEYMKEALSGRISAFSGNTGVGKSSVLNAVFPSLELKTGAISDKLGRGRHTTRQSELIKVDGGYVADTPGFSSLDGEDSVRILKDELPFAFAEFEKYLGQCKFSTCAHTKDKGCKIIEAVENGEIDPSRHASYVMMYNEVKDIKDWQLK